MKIRHVLVALTSFLGLVLVAAVAVQIRAAILEHRDATQLVASNAVREQLLRAAGALAEERAHTYGLLLAPGSGQAQQLASVRARVDGYAGTARRLMETESRRLGSAQPSLQAFGVIDRELQAARAAADAALAAPDQLRRDHGPRWFARITDLVESMSSLRISLLQQERPVDPAVRTEAHLRYYSSFLTENISRNEALLAQALAGRSGLNAADLNRVSSNAGRVELAWEMIREQLSGSVTPTVRAAFAAAEQAFATSMQPAQETLLSGLRGRAWLAMSPEQWTQATSKALAAVAAAQEATIESSRRRLDEILAAARAAVVGWLAVASAGVLAVLWSVLFVRRRIALPLEDLSGAMLRLAANDLASSLPKLAHQDEIGEMTDTLRVFKANALRRERLQQERAMLHSRLEATYRQLRRDLEAAASIQTAMLPAAAAFAGVRFRGLFRPSSLVAGDTYNVVERQDGTVGFFQVDVAGHGAPAALISVASHHTLSQALVKAEDGKPLEDIVAEINADWPEDLPYFTMILGETDPRSGRAAIVQAGHPSPLLIPREGTVRTLGDGGFPVGMIRSATYERLVFDFRPGDRLMLFSDGLLDAESPTGEPFSEERLVALVAAQARRPTARLLEILDAELRIWRGSENLEDDVSVLVLECETENAEASGPEAASLEGLKEGHDADP